MNKKRTAIVVMVDETHHHNYLGEIFIANNISYRSGYNFSVNFVDDQFRNLLITNGECIRELEYKKIFFEVLIDGPRITKPIFLLDDDKNKFINFCQSGGGFLYDDNLFDNSLEPSIISNFMVNLERDGRFDCFMDDFVKTRGFHIIREKMFRAY